MTSYSVTESTVEDATLTRLEGLGWQAAYGPDIAPDAPNAERDRCGQGGLERRLRASHIWVSNARNIYDEPER